MGKLLIFSLCLLMLFCFVDTEDGKKRIFRECKPFPHSFFESSPLLLDIIQSIAWFFGNLFSAAYFLLNAAVLTVCEITSNIFSGVKYAIKLVEYIGCGVKAVLQLNYNLVSSMFEWLAGTARFTADCVRSFGQGIMTGLASPFQRLESLLYVFINSIPVGFYHASQSAGAATNATGSLLYQSYLGWKYVLRTPASALLTIATSVRAVIECLLVSIWNTGFLLMELLYSFLTSIFLGIEFVGKTVLTCLISAWNQLINSSKWLLYNLQALLGVMAQISIEVLNTIVWTINSTFVSISRGIYLTCTTIYWLLSISLTEVGKCLITCSKALLNHTVSAVHCLPGGHWTFMGLSLLGFFVYYSWAVFRINIFTAAFEFLRTSLQGVLALIASCQISTLSRFMQTDGQHAQLLNVPKEEKDRSLMEELEREREQNLCVVCQTEKKNVVVMPCRHMCMCQSCCTQLFQSQRHRRKTCPLCRHVITSTLKIYA